MSEPNGHDSRESLWPVPLSKTERAVIGLFALGALASLPFLVHPWYETKVDASIYIASARSLLAGDGYRYLGEAFTVRPPGFSVMIAFVLGIFGTNFHALNLFVAASGVATVVLLVLLIRPRLGTPVALGVGLAVWMIAAFQRLCNLVLSDVPGSALLLTVLLVERWSVRSPSVRREVFLGCLIALAAYVRSIGILVLPAILISRLLYLDLREGPWKTLLVRQLGVVTLTTFVLLLPWSIRNSAAMSPTAVDQLAVHSYSTGLFHSDKSDPASPRLGIAEIVERSVGQSSAIAAGLSCRLQRQRYCTAHASLAIPLVSCALFLLVWRREPRDFLLLNILVAVALHFGFQNRLLLPAALLLLPAVVEVARATFQRVLGARAALVATWLGLLVLIIVDFDPQRNWESVRNEDRRSREIARAIFDSVEPDARLASAVGAHHAVYLERDVYSFKQVVRRTGRPEEAERIIDKYEIDTVFLSETSPDDRRLLPYFERCYPGARTVSGVRIVRVRGSDATHSKPRDARCPIADDQDPS